MMRAHLAGWLLLAWVPPVALADPGDLVAKVDLEFLRETELVVSYMCLGETDEDCVPWANAYLYEARLREILSGDFPEKKFLVIYGRHALGHEDLKGVVGKFSRLTDNEDGAAYQLVRRGSEEKLACFEWWGADGNGALEQPESGELLHCFGPGTGRASARVNDEVLRDPEKSLRAANDAYIKALVDGDTTMLAALLTEGFIYTNPAGEVVDRAAQIEQIRSGKLDITTGRGSDETIRLHGKMGIVAGRFEAKGMYEGLPFDAVKRYTSVWVIRDGRWQILAEHGTLLAPVSD
jgi:ketosteroid isomerase-like protein